MIWSFYRLSDGAFTGQRYSGVLDNLAANTPEGCGAIEGEYDHLSYRVDLTDPPVVVDYVPTKPADTATATYTWDADVRRWIAAPTLEGKRVPLRVIVRRRIALWEARQHRPVREWILASLAVRATIVPTIQAIEDRIVALRAKLQAIDAATNEAELPTDLGEDPP